MIEQWKSVASFPAYSVSTAGRVRRGGHVLRGQRQQTGYIHVILHKGPVKKQIGVHRLVLLTFAPPVDESLHCLHWDGDRTNNALSNLRWGTPKENAQDTIRLGRMVRGEAKSIMISGEKSGRAKLTARSVIEIRRRYALGQESLRALGKEFGVDSKTIHAAVTNRTWINLEAV